MSASQKAPRRPGPGRVRRMAESDYTSTPPAPSAPYTGLRCPSCGTLGWDPYSGRVCPVCKGAVAKPTKPSRALDWGSGVSP